MINYHNQNNYEEDLHMLYRIFIPYLLILLCLCSVACSAPEPSDTISETSTTNISTNQSTTNLNSEINPQASNKSSEDVMNRRDTATAYPDINKDKKADITSVNDPDGIFSMDLPSSWVTFMGDTGIETNMPNYDSLASTAILPMLFAINENTGSNILIFADFRGLLTEEPLPLNFDQYVEMQYQDVISQGNNLSVASISRISVDNVTTGTFETEAPGIQQIFYIMIGDEPRMSCGSMAVLVTGTIGTQTENDTVREAMNSLKILPTAGMTDSCDNRTELSALDLFPDAASVNTTTSVESGGLTLIEWEALEDGVGDLAIVGVIENTSSNLKEFVYITFDVYDTDGYSLEPLEAFTERLSPGQKWKFEAMSMIPATEVGAIEMFAFGTQFD